MSKEPRIVNPKRLTLKTVAKAAGVSPSTVSRVLSGKMDKYKISAKTIKHVKTIADKLNFRANLVARSLKLRKTNLIGVIIPDIRNSFYSQIVHYIETEAFKKQYNLLLCNTQENLDIEKESLALLINRNVDGIIICPVGFETEYINEIYRKFRTPMVVMDRYSESLEVPCVGVDNYSGAFEATEKLIGLGHKRIVCLSGERTFITQERIRGYREAMVKNGLEPWIIGNEYSEKAGNDQMVGALELEDRPTAVLSLNNALTFGVLSALWKMNLKSPDDLSIISFDEQIFSKYLSVPMYTIAQDNELIAKISFDLIMKMIDPDKTKGFQMRFTIKTKPKPRESVRRID